MTDATHHTLPPPLSQAPSSSELQRLLHGLRTMPAGRAAVAPPPPPPMPRRRPAPRHELGTTHPALVRPYVLAALAEARH